MSEQISALIDNEVALDDVADLIASLGVARQSTDAWASYHLIGDAMRSDMTLSHDFKHRLMQRIDLEPTVLAPNAIQADIKKPVHFKDKLPVSWSLAASFAAVMVVGWMVLQQQSQPGNTPTVTEVATVEPSNQLIPNEYLMAHQASAPSTSSYYIQSVNYSE